MLHFYEEKGRKIFIILIIIIILLSAFMFLASKFIVFNKGGVATDTGMGKVSEVAVVEVE